MGIAMELVPPALAVEPGRLGRMDVHLRNGGAEACEVAVEVPPGERDWTWVHPESCSVAPRAEEVVSVFFKPSCGPHPPAGRHSVEIVARESGGDGVVTKAEGIVDVAPWVDTAGTLDPMVAYDQMASEYTLHVENRGNVPITADLGTDDPSGALQVGVQPTRVTAGPGQTATATVSVQARKKLKRGEQRYRVCVTARVEGGSQLRVEGAFRQQGVKGPK